MFDDGTDPAQVGVEVVFSADIQYRLFFVLLESCDGWSGDS